jgi:hypothetical protein
MCAFCIPVAWLILALLLRPALGGRRLALLFAAVAVATWMAIATAVLGYSGHLTRTPLLIWWGATDAILLLGLEMALPPMHPWFIGSRAEKWGVNEYATVALIALAGVLLIGAGMLAILGSSSSSATDINFIQHQFAILSPGVLWTIILSWHALFMTMLAASLIVALAAGGPAAQALAAVLVALCPPIFHSPATPDNAIFAALWVSIVGVIAMQTFRAPTFTIARGVWIALALLLCILTSPSRPIATLPATAAYLLLYTLLPLLGLLAKRQLRETSFWNLLIAPYALLLVFVPTFWTSHPIPYLSAILCCLAAPAAILLMTRRMRIPATIIMTGLMINLLMNLYPG